MKVLFLRTYFPKKQFTMQKKLLFGLLSHNTHARALHFPIPLRCRFLSKAIDLEGSKEILQIDTFTTRQRGARCIILFYDLTAKFPLPISVGAAKHTDGMWCERARGKGLHAANVFMAARIYSLSKKSFPKSVREIIHLWGSFDADERRRRRADYTLTLFLKRPEGRPGRRTIKERRQRRSN